MKIPILYEHEHYIIVSKPNGIVVETDLNDNVTITDVLKEQYGYEFLQAAHRLDMPVSGVLIITKSATGIMAFSRLFQLRKIKKTYHALVKNKPEPDGARLHHHLKRIQKHNVSKAYDIPVEGSKDAVLDYKVIGEKDEVYLLEINLQTGRHHQIRAQMKHINCPLIGDVKYGSKVGFDKHQIMLHAVQIRFVCPFQDKVIVVRDLYPDGGLWRLFK